MPFYLNLWYSSVDSEKLVIRKHRSVASGQRYNQRDPFGAPATSQCASPAAFRGNHHGKIAHKNTVEKSHFVTEKSTRLLFSAAKKTAARFDALNNHLINSELAGYLILSNLKFTGFWKCMFAYYTVSGVSQTCVFVLLVLSVSYRRKRG